MKKSMLKFISNVLIIVLFINSNCFASSPIYLEIDNDIYSFNNNDIIDLQNDNKETEETLSEEEQMLLYAKSIEDAKHEVEYPDRCNFPTLLKQKEFHPVIDDYFGKERNDKPIHKVSVEDDVDKKNMIALTFDSAFINDYTFRILDTLDKYNFKCTFFMTHDFMKKNPDHIIEIVKRGHEIGNHSTTHPHFTKLTDVEIVKEVWRTHCLYKYLTGLNMSLFRFPYGECDERTINIVKNLGYYPIQWTADSLDWKNESTSSIIRRLDATNAYQEGNIVLFHNGAKYTPDCLDDILKKIVDKGLKVVKVSDLIYPHNFALVNGTQFKKKDDN